MTTGPVEIIAAPSNLGLRPPSPGHEPGVWRAPELLLGAGIAARLDAERVVALPRPPYEFEMQPGTRIRNGVRIREHALELADAVAGSLSGSHLPLVLGGDCSVLLGCLVGARRGGRCGLVHVDGHRDFFHPGNYDTATRLGSVAGMDLALATGRGELLLTHWPVVGVPLVPDQDVIQVGDREAEAAPPPDPTAGDLLPPSIARVTAQQIVREGVRRASERVERHLRRRSLTRAWLHLDLDVLDQRVMPAVDSPGTPGFDFEQLAELLSRLMATGRVIGIDVTIYDPELDPQRRYPPSIVECLVEGLEPTGSLRAGTPNAGGGPA